MRNIIKRLLNEQVQRPDYLEKVSKILLQSGPPYFQLMEDNFNVTDIKDQYEVLQYIYDEDITISKGTSSNISNDYGRIYSEDTISGYWEKNKYDSNGNKIYFENSHDFWYKKEYDSRDNQIYYGDSDGDWDKNEYDSNGNHIYFENSDGWVKKEYDSNGRRIYEESSDGDWWKREYDENDKVIYYEDSDGKIRDYRKKN